MDSKEWEMMTKGKLVGFAIGLSVFFLLLFQCWIYDTRIAEGVKLVGWIGIGATCLWVLWRAFQDRHRVPEPQNFSPAF